MKKMCDFIKIKKIYSFNFMVVYINIVFYYIICVTSQVRKYFL